MNGRLLAVDIALLRTLSAAIKFVNDRTDGEKPRWKYEPLELRFLATLCSRPRKKRRCLSM
jgi:hypothetical protein